MQNLIVLLVVLLSGSFVSKTAKAQDRKDNFKGYDRSSKSIVIYDAETLQPLDSLDVRDLLRENSSTPIHRQEIQNSEVFELMEKEELIHEQMILKEPE